MTHVTRCKVRYKNKNERIYFVQFKGVIAFRMKCGVPSTSKILG